MHPSHQILATSLGSLDHTICGPFAVSGRVKVGALRGTFSSTNFSSKSHRLFVCLRLSLHHIAHKLTTGFQVMLVHVLDTQVLAVLVLVTQVLVNITGFQFEFCVRGLIGLLRMVKFLSK